MPSDLVIHQAICMSMGLSDGLELPALSPIFLFYPDPLQS